MNKIDLGVITASAVVASQLAVGAGHAECVSALPVVSVLDGATMSSGVEKIELPDSAKSVSVRSPIQTGSIERWTKPEKNRYRKLVVKFASSGLSESEEKELRELELVRTRFEDSRTPSEIIDEFRTRRHYAELIASLKHASLGLKR